MGVISSWWTESDMKTALALILSIGLALPKPQLITDELGHQLCAPADDSEPALYCRPGATCLSGLKWCMSKSKPGDTFCSPATEDLAELHCAPGETCYSGPSIRLCEADHVFCPANYDPVCSTRGQTFGNRCEAEDQSGQEVQCQGE